jgi:hypothetical protein
VKAEKVAGKPVKAEKVAGKPAKAEKAKAEIALKADAPKKRARTKKDE